MIPDRSQFRDGHRYLAAVASEVARPALRLYARSWSRGGASPPHAWRRGVILGASHIGDVLYRTCSLAQLAAGLPDCRWTYVTSAAGAELLRDNLAIADRIVIANDEPISRDIAPREFDVALCSDNIRHHAALLAAVHARIPNRVAFGSKGLTGLATIPIAVPRASWPAQFAIMVRAVTGDDSSRSLRPRVFLNDGDRAEARAAWGALPASDAPLTIAASVTTRQRIGVFPLELFAGILGRAREIEPRLRVMLVGSAADRPALERLRALLGDDRVVMANVLGLRAFVALLQKCDAFLGSDSGPRHMANAAGIPVFFVRNMAVPEIEAGRYCDTETDLAPHGEYLDASANAEALRRVDVGSASAALVEHARACARERAAGLR